MNKASLSAEENLYFIAIVPPAQLYQQALELKEYFKTTYNSKAALNSPPHITLHMPFKWKLRKEDILTARLKTFSESATPVHVKLEGYGSFPPRVIFMNVVPSDELSLLQKQLQRFCRQELNLFNADYKDLPFHPHLTLAFRDLKKSNFQNAWDEFRTKPLSDQFIAGAICLLKHNGERWKLFQEFTLGRIPPV